MDKKRIALHFLFWIVTALFLGTYISYRSGFTSTNSWIILMLLPVCMGTAYFINYYLIKSFLIPGHYGKFLLFTAYSLIVAFYLESLILIFIFVYVADFDSSQANFDTLFTVVGMVLPIIVGVAIKVFRLFIHSDKKDEGTQVITLRADRKNVQVDVNDIVYIEGLKDYVKMYLNNEAPLITKEKMMTLQNHLDDKGFVRVHKSYIVATSNIKSYNSRELEMSNGKVVPIGKTYRESFKARLQTAR